MRHTLTLDRPLPPSTTARSSTPRWSAPTRSFPGAHAGLVVVHLVQAALVYLVAGDIVIPITHEVGADASAPLLDVSMGAALAAFFVAAALSHGVSATVLRSTYEADLRGGRSRVRWAEFALSAPLLMVLIGLYAGVTDVLALASVGGATLVLVGCGWKHEALNPPGRRSSTRWQLWAGVAAATVPWSIIAGQMIGAANPREFALATFLSLFILWAGFGINQWLQFRKVGQWADNLYGERTYLVLSLVAKSALAWQVVTASSLL